LVTGIGHGPANRHESASDHKAGGSIYLTFTDQPYTEGSTTTNGIGNTILKEYQWTMANQMSTGSSAAQVGHWAYMLQSMPGSASWYSLHGFNISVPQFMRPCVTAAPKSPG
jgi:hypothetical protein